MYSLQTDSNQITGSLTLESNDHHCKREPGTLRGGGADTELHGEGKGAKTTSCFFLHRVHPLGTKTPNFSKKEHGVRWTGVREWEKEGDGETPK